MLQLEGTGGGLRAAGCEESAGDQVVCCRCMEMFDAAIEHVQLWEGRLLCLSCVVEIAAQGAACLERGGKLLDLVREKAVSAAARLRRS